jgi:acyl carrier protein
MNEGWTTQVKEIMADVFNVPLGQLDDTASPSSIAAWDSVQHLNLVLALEQAFDVEFDPEEIPQLQSMAAIVQLIRNKRERIAA